MKKFSFVILFAALALCQVSGSSNTIPDDVAAILTALSSIRNAKGKVPAGATTTAVQSVNTLSAKIATIIQKAGSAGIACLAASQSGIIGLQTTLASLINEAASAIGSGPASSLINELATIPLADVADRATLLTQLNSLLITEAPQLEVAVAAYLAGAVAQVNGTAMAIATQIQTCINAGGSQPLTSTLSKHPAVKAVVG